MTKGEAARSRKDGRKYTRWCRLPINSSKTIMWDQYNYCVMGYAYLLCGGAFTLIDVSYIDYAILIYSAKKSIYMTCCTNTALIYAQRTDEIPSSRGRMSTRDLSMTREGILSSTPPKKLVKQVASMTPTNMCNS